MTERTTPVERAIDGAERVAELQAELARCEEEILRLRDLLIGKDVELGAARGQLAVLEANSRRVAGVALKIQSRIPGGMRIGGALRRLQGPRG
jgi:hypothetical protein